MFESQKLPFLFFLYAQAIPLIRTGHYEGGTATSMFSIKSKWKFTKILGQHNLQSHEAVYHSDVYEWPNVFVVGK